MRIRNSIVTGKKQKPLPCHVITKIDKNWAHLFFHEKKNSRKRPSLPNPLLSTRFLLPAALSHVNLSDEYFCIAGLDENGRKKAATTTIDCLPILSIAHSVRSRLLYVPLFMQIQGRDPAIYVDGSVVLLSATSLLMLLHPTMGKK